MAQARRLHELLAEPQEPFYVDKYLIERGYSTNLLEAKEGLSLSFCWPRNASKNQLRFKTVEFTRSKGGFRGGFLSEFLYRKFVKKTTKCEKKTLKDGIASPTHELVLSSCRLSKESGSETKKHSPVSVLEMHSYIASPADSINDKEEKPQNFLSLIDSPKKAFDILEELLKLAYEPSTNYISESSQNDSKEQKAVGFEDWDLNSDESSTDEEKSSFSIEREDFEAIREIVISEFAKFMTNWDKFEFDTSRGEVEAEIVNVILEEIMEELILELKPNSANARCKL